MNPQLSRFKDHEKFLAIKKIMAYRLKLSIRIRSASKIDKECHPRVLSWALALGISYIDISPSKWSINLLKSPLVRQFMISGQFLGVLACWLG